MGGDSGMVAGLLKFMLAYGDVGKLCRISPTSTYHLQGPLPRMQTEALERLTREGGSNGICEEVELGVERARVFCVPSARRGRLEEGEASQRVAIALGLTTGITSMDEFREKVLDINLVVVCNEDTRSYTQGGKMCSCPTFTRMFFCSHVALVNLVISGQAGSRSGPVDISLPRVTWGGRPRKSRGPLDIAATDKKAKKRFYSQTSEAYLSGQTPNSPEGPEAFLNSNSRAADWKGLEDSDTGILMAEIAQLASTGAFRSPKAMTAAEADCGNMERHGGGLEAESECSNKNRRLRTNEEAASPQKPRRSKRTRRKPAWMRGV